MRWLSQERRLLHKREGLNWIPGARAKVERTGSQRCMRSSIHTPGHVCAHHTHVKIKFFKLKRGRERMLALNTKSFERLEEKKANGVFP